MPIVLPNVVTGSQATFLPLDLVIRLQQNGLELFGEPYRFSTACEAIAPFDYLEATTGSYQTLRLPFALNIRVLVLTLNVAGTVRLNGQAANGIALAAGGVLAFVNGLLSTATLVTLNVSAQAQVRGFAAGERA